MEIPQVSYGILNVNFDTTANMETILNSQSKAIKKVDELKHQVTQLQQITSTKQSQNKSGSEDVQELKQVVCSQIFKGMACQKY